MNISPIATCSFVLLLASQPSLAQDSGLPLPGESDYAESIGEGPERSASRERTRRTIRRTTRRTTRRTEFHRRRSTPRATERPAERPARGVRGALLGEDAGSALRVRGRAPRQLGPEDPAYRAREAARDPDYKSLWAAKLIEGYRDLPGKLFIRQSRDHAHAVHPRDVRQGNPFNAYLMASLAAVAAVNPQLIEQMITDHGDGTYTVRFFERHLERLWRPGVALGLDVPETTRFRDVVVDGDFVHWKTSQGGGLAFADTYGTVRGKHEIWPLVIEKAYAKLKGSYEPIGWHGREALALNMITGAGASNDRFGIGPADQVERRIREAFSEGRPVVLRARRGKDLPHGALSAFIYAVTGVEGDRFYLHNPWGRRHVGWLTADEITQAFRSLTIGN